MNLTKHQVGALEYLRSCGKNKRLARYLWLDAVNYHHGESDYTDEVLLPLLQSELVSIADNVYEITNAGKIALKTAKGEPDNVTLAMPRKTAIAYHNVIYKREAGLPLTYDDRKLLSSLMDALQNAVDTVE